MKRSAIVAGFVLVSATLGGSAVLLLRGHSAPAGGATAAAGKGAPQLQEAPERALSRVGWEPGTQYVHTVDYHVVLGQDVEQRQPGQSLDLRVRGELRSLVYEASPPDASGRTRVKVRYELTSPKLESPVADAAAAAGMKASEAALARPFGVEYDGEGRALELLVQPGLDSIALGIVRELASTTQLSLPQAQGARWTALETDTAGEYQATYTQLAAATLQRQKTEYVRIAGAHGLHPAGKAGPRIRAAVAEFKLDDWGRAADVESHAQVTTPPAIDGGGPPFMADTEVRLHFVSRSKLPVDAAMRLTGLQRTSLTPDARDYAQAADASDRALVGQTTPQELLTDLAKLPPGDAQAASTVQVRMGALVRQQPNSIGPLLAKLNPQNASTILGALGSAGTPEAQKGLADVTRDAGRDVGVRQTAIDSMLTLEHPTHDVPDALQAAMKSDDPSLRNNSSLMLGAMSHKMAEDEPEKAAEVNHKLANDLSSATETSERMRLLASLGNSGASEGLTQIAQALKSADPAERAQAASSLRFVKDPQADTLLSQVIVSDPIQFVRVAGLGAAAYRSYEPLAKALEAAAKDPEVQVRLQLVTTLGSLAPGGADALLLLDRMAQADPNKDVKAQAKLALEHAGSVAQNK